MSKPKERKTPKPKKQRRSDDPSTPAASSVDRRKSGRGASAAKIYRDRDDSEDDEEMMEGVAEWEYLDGEESGSDAVETDDEDDKAVSPSKGKDDTPEISPELEQESELEEEPEPTLPKSDGKATKGKLSRSSKFTPIRKKKGIEEIAELENADESEDVEMEDSPPPTKSGSTKKSKDKAALKNGVAKGNVQQETPRPKRGRRSNTKTSPDEEDEGMGNVPPLRTASTRRNKAKAAASSPSLEEDEELSDKAPQQSVSSRRTKTKASASNVAIDSPRPKRGTEPSKSKPKSPTPEVEEEDIEMEDSPPVAKPARTASKRQAKAPIVVKKAGATRGTRTAKGKGNAKSEMYVMDQSD